MSILKDGSGFYKKTSFKKFRPENPSSNVNDSIPNASKLIFINLKASEMKICWCKSTKCFINELKRLCLDAVRRLTQKLAVKGVVAKP